MTSRITQTLVLAIPRDEIYMTFLDGECISMFLGEPCLVERGEGARILPSSKRFEGEWLECTPTERLRVQVQCHAEGFSTPLELIIYLEEIDDGTRVFFHTEGDPTHLRHWKEILSHYLIDPLAEFFRDE